MKEYFRPTYSEAQLHTPRSTSHAWHLPEMTFYITDSCSLTCSGCVTYNELALKDGVMHVSGTALERMNTWARLIDIDEISVLGGEPLSHPDLNTWLDYLQATWPNALRYNIVTNGELLPSHTDQVMQWLENGWSLEVSCHSPQAHAATQAWWQAVASQMQHPPHSQVEHNQDGEQSMEFWDHQGQPLIQINQCWLFYPRRYTTHEDHIQWKPLTNAHAQHRICPGKTCAHMVNGVMYRCPVQATIPRLAANYKVEGTNGLAQQDLGFDPLKGGNLSAWMRDLTRPTSQCSLCNWQEKRIPLEDPYSKKIKILRQPK
jgi:organic radical activating enzyme